MGLASHLYTSMKKLTFEEFVTKAKNIHGEFKQLGGVHLAGKSGCKTCGNSSSVEKRTMPQTEFVKRAIEIYGNLDSYNKVSYVNTMTNVIITCNTHGDYKVRPHNYLKMGQRCVLCTAEGIVNPNPQKKIQSIRETNRRKTDPKFTMIKRLRKRLRESLVKNHEVRDRKLKEILGCSKEDLIRHIESKFVEGMSWDNMRLWHIDHIIPLASAKTIEDIYKLNHYTNLQPLWAEDNLRKNARLPNDYCV